MTNEHERKKEGIRETVSMRRKSILQDNIIQIQGRAFNDITRLCEANAIVNSDAVETIIFKANLDILRLTDDKD